MGVDEVGARCWKGEIWDFALMVEVAPSPSFSSGRNDSLPLFTPREEQDELHYQDTDLDVPEQRDSRCKVKWTPEEVSESLKFAQRGALGCASDMVPWVWVTPLQSSPAGHDLTSCPATGVDHVSSVLSSGLNEAQRFRGV